MADRGQRAGLGLFLAASLAVLGGAVGGVLSRFTNQPGDMGWDQIANALGGMMLGVLAGTVIAVVLARRLRLPSLRVLTIATTLLAGSMVAFVAVRFRQEQAQANAEAGRDRPLAPKTEPVPPVP